MRVRPCQGGQLSSKGLARIAGDVTRQDRNSAPSQGVVLCDLPVRATIRCTEGPLARSVLSSAFFARSHGSRSSTALARARYPCPHHRGGRTRTRALLSNARNRDARRRADPSARALPCRLDVSQAPCTSSPARHSRRRGRDEWRFSTPIAELAWLGRVPENTRKRPGAVRGILLVSCRRTLHESWRPSARSWISRTCLRVVGVARLLPRPGGCQRGSPADLERSAGSVPPRGPVRARHERRARWASLCSPRLKKQATEPSD